MSKPAAALGAFAMTVASALAPQSAEARRVWDGHGAGGGKVFTVECPKDKAMVGITGASGRYIDRLQIVCATLYDDGSYGPPERYGDPIGGSGGTPISVRTCPRNEKMFDMSIIVDRIDARFLGGIGFQCRDANDRFRSVPVINTGSYDRAGADFDVKPGVQSCPQEHFVGLSIYVRDYVKAVGVICDSVAITPVAVVAKAAPKPAAPSGPPVAPPSAMRGSWNTRTSTDGYFTVILIPEHDGMGALAGQPIPVKGQFINSQGANDYDGGLQGYIVPGTRTLQYSYTQKNGASGTGTFTLSPGGNTLTGTGKTSDGQEFTWNGTRAK